MQMSKVEQHTKAIETLLEQADTQGGWILRDDNTISTSSGHFVEVSPDAEKLGQFIASAPDAIRFLLERVESLSTALQFYASELRYGNTRVYVNPHFREQFPLTAQEDRGATARRALGWD